MKKASQNGEKMVKNIGINKYALLPVLFITAYKKLAISTAVEAENSNFHQLAVSHCEIN